MAIEAHPLDKPVCTIIGALNIGTEAAQMALACTMAVLTYLRGKAMLNYKQITLNNASLIKANNCGYGRHSAPSRGMTTLVNTL